MDITRRGLFGSVLAAAVATEVAATPVDATPVRKPRAPKVTLQVPAPGDWRLLLQFNNRSDVIVDDPFALVTTEHDRLNERTLLRFTMPPINMTTFAGSVLTNVTAQTTLITGDWVRCGTWEVGVHAAGIGIHDAGVTSLTLKNLHVYLT